MSKKSNKGLNLNSNILEPVTGSYNNLVFTKKGVLYFKDFSKRKNNSKT